MTQPTKDDIKPGAKFKVVVPDPIPPKFHCPSEWALCMRRVHGQLVEIKRDALKPEECVWNAGDGQPHVNIQDVIYGVPLEWLYFAVTPEPMTPKFKVGDLVRYLGKVWKIDEVKIPANDSTPIYHLRGDANGIYLHESSLEPPGDPRVGDRVYLERDRIESLPDWSCHLDKVHEVCATEFFLTLKGVRMDHLDTVKNLWNCTGKVSIRAHDEPLAAPYEIPPRRQTPAPASMNAEIEKIKNERDEFEVKLATADRTVANLYHRALEAEQTRQAPGGACRQAAARPRRASPASSPGVAPRARREARRMRGEGPCPSLCGRSHAPPDTHDACDALGGAPVRGELGGFASFFRL